MAPRDFSTTNGDYQKAVRDHWGSTIAIYVGGVIGSLLYSIIFSDNVVDLSDVVFALLAPLTWTFLYWYILQPSAYAHGVQRSSLLPLPIPDVWKKAMINKPENEQQAKIKDLQQGLDDAPTNSD